MGDSSTQKNSTPQGSAVPQPNKVNAFVHTMRMDSVNAQAGSTKQTIRDSGGQKAAPKIETTNNQTAPLPQKTLAPTYAEPREMPSTKEDFAQQKTNPTATLKGGNDAAFIIDNNNEWPTYNFVGNKPNTNLAPKPTGNPSFAKTIAPTFIPTATTVPTSTNTAPKTTPAIMTPFKSISSPEQASPLIPPLQTKIKAEPLIVSKTQTNTAAPTANKANVVSPNATNPEIKVPPQQTMTSSFQQGLDMRLQSKETSKQQTQNRDEGSVGVNGTPIRPQNTVKTLTSDIANQVQGGMSLADVAAAEARRRRQAISAGQVPSDPSAQKNLTRRIVFAIGGILLIGGGGFALWIGYRYFTNTPTVTPSAVIVPPVIKSDASENIILDSIRADDISATIRSAIERTNIPIGNIKELPLYANAELLGRPLEAVTDATSKTSPTGAKKLPVKLTASELLRSLSPYVPTSLPRALKNEWYFGVYNNIGSNPVLIVQTETPEIVYRDMLTWEKSQNIVKDLQNIFLAADERLKPPFFMNTESGSTYEFRDAVIDNKDIRVLTNEKGDIVFMYGFLDNNTLVITTHKLALREAYNRIVLSKLVR